MVKNKKILIVSQYYLPYTSGITIYTRRLSEGFVKRGYKVTILTSKHAKDLLNKETRNGVKIIRLPVILKYQRGAFSPTIIFNLVKLMKSHDFIIVNVPYLEVGIVSILAKILRKPMFIIYHSDLKTSNNLLFKLITFVYSTSLKVGCIFSTRIVVNSLTHVKKSKIKEFAYKVKRIIPPIDTELFYKSRGVNFMKKYGIRRDEKVIGFVGRFAEEKGLTYLISAIPFVQKKIRKVKLILAGTGEKLVGGKKESIKGVLENLVKKLNLKNIKFLGFLSEKDLVDFYSICDVFVFPSVAIDTFGLVQAEALLCGTPVVSTTLPGPRDVIDLTGYGLLVPPKNPKKLAEAIITILKNRKKYAPSRRRLLKYFGIEKTIDEYEKLLMKYKNC